MNDNEWIMQYILNGWIMLVLNRYGFGDRHSHNIQQKYIECPRNEWTVQNVLKGHTSNSHSKLTFFISWLTHLAACRFTLVFTTF